MLPRQLRPSNSRLLIEETHRATNTDTSAAVQVNTSRTVPGFSGGNGGGNGGGGGGGGQRAPDCTTSGGQPAYISYGPLMFTTQEEQRTEIRPWEQRPGRWAWQYCGGEPVDLVFLPDAQAVDAVARRCWPSPPASSSHRPRPGPAPTPRPSAASS